MTNHSIGDGNWRQGANWMGSAYKYLGCIYNPDIKDTLTYGSTPIMQRGSTGYYVKVLQRNLNRLGYKLTVDGIFGPKTEMAVEKLQAVEHITVDGVVGINTQKAIINLINHN